MWTIVIQKTRNVIDSFVIRNEDGVTKKVFDRFLREQYNAFKEEPVRYKKETNKNKQTKSYKLLRIFL